MDSSVDVLKTKIDEYLDKKGIFQFYGNNLSDIIEYFSEDGKLNHEEFLYLENATEINNNCDLQSSEILRCHDNFLNDFNDNLSECGKDFNIIVWRESPNVKISYSDFKSHLTPVKITISARFCLLSFPNPNSDLRIRTLNRNAEIEYL